MTMETENKDGGVGGNVSGKSLLEEVATVSRNPESIVSHFNWDRESEAEDLAVDLTGSRLLPLVFRWNGEAETIHVSGSYDNWRSRMPLVKSHDSFYTVVEVPEGTHQYKYLVDGEWKCHPNEPMVDNEIGSQNNIIVIKESDCDLSEILSENGPKGGALTGGEFSQHIPPKDASYCFLRSGPPAIPPHLLETVLNKEVPTYCEPTFLAEPNHVILNHLYTLSIKDGVMVMGTTHRYRKKYITTLLYMPIISK